METLSLEFNVRQKMHLEPDAMSYNGVLNACAMTGRISSPLVQLETTVFSSWQPFALGELGRCKELKGCLKRCFLFIWSLSSNDSKIGVLTPNPVLHQIPGSIICFFLPCIGSNACASVRMTFTHTTEPRMCIGHVGLRMRAVSKQRDFLHARFDQCLRRERCGGPRRALAATNSATETRAKPSLLQQQPDCNK